MRVALIAGVGGSDEEAKTYVRVPMEQRVTERETVDANGREGGIVKMLKRSSDVRERRPATDACASGRP